MSEPAYWHLHRMDWLHWAPLPETIVVSLQVWVCLPFT